MNEMIYHNFDKLEITFKGAFPQDVLDILNEAKEKAQVTYNNEAVQLGESGTEFKVYPTGVGGVLLGFETMDGGIQFGTQNTDRKDLWNIFIGVRSGYLALNGYQAAKSRLLEILHDLGAETDERFCPFTGEYTKFPEESIRRIDYCFDFLMPNFKPDREAVVYHKNAKMILHGEMDISTTRQGITDNSLVIGSKKALQIEIYNKTKEIKDKGNEHWFKIWEHDAAKDGPVWRVECRMCKEFLRRNEMLTFIECENRFSERLEAVFETIRYTVPTNDSNRSRWKNTDFWNKALTTAKQPLFSVFEPYDKALIKRLKNQKSLEQIDKMIPGLIASKAVLEELPFNRISEALDKAVMDFKYALKNNPDKLKDSYQKSKKRYQEPA